MNGWSELYPDLNDPLPIYVGTDEFENPLQPRRQHVVKPTAEQVAERRAQTDAVMAAFMRNTWGWDEVKIAEELARV